jgi:gamma-glutamyltranspeptidase/glutathione hydrolase
MPDVVRAEHGFPDEVLAGLRAKGHEVVVPLGQTSTNSIAVTPIGLLGAADPRTRGAAAVGQ